jgi:endonuclease/exonuclease/phosphatase family metal-dependent hydrolase
MRRNVAMSRILFGAPLCLAIGGLACGGGNVPTVPNSGPPSADAGQSPASDGGAADAPSQGCMGGAGATRVRLMAANISSGNSQSYDEGAGARLFQALKPDIVMIQEFTYKSRGAADMREFIDQNFGAEFHYFQGDPKLQIPNGIISKYPLLASGEWQDPQVSNRTFVWARIDVPGPKDLLAVSVHLLTSKSGARKLEGDALVAEIDAVAGESFVAIGGDFNTGSRSEGVLTSIASRVVTQGPFPSDQSGNEDTNAGRNNPYDWVVVDPALSARETPLILRGNRFAHGLVFDTRVYAPLSELQPPLVGNESAAPNMQHMPVLRDFNFCP